MTKKFTLFEIALAVIVLGVPLLVFYYGLDGTLINPVVTYRSGTNPLALETTKTHYRSGEMVAYFSSACKNREAVGVIQWTLSDRYLVPYAPHDPHDAPVGCYPDGSGKIIVPVEILPEKIEPGCDYHFAATIKRDIGGGRIRTSYLKTNDFCISS